MLEIVFDSLTTHDRYLPSMGKHKSYYSPVASCCGFPLMVNHILSGGA